MEPKIVELDGFTVVGIRYFGDNKNQEIAQLWSECKKQCGDDGKCLRHVNAKPGSPCLGVCSMIPGEKENFEYIIGVMVEKTDQIDEGYVTKVVPAQKYAVFTHKGLLTTLMGTYEYIFGDWANKTDYKVDEHLNFEWYDNRFKDNDPTSEFDIYVPIK